MLAWMINTSACKQPSNVSTLRCKMNRWKAPLIANIPWAQSPFLPRRAVIATAVPRLSSLGVTGARAGVGRNVTGPGRGQSAGSGSHCPGDLSPTGAEASGTCRPPQGPTPGSGLGIAVKYKIPASTGSPQPFRGQAGTGECRAGPHFTIVNMSVCADSVTFIYLRVCVRCLCMNGQHTRVRLYATHTMCTCVYAASVRSMCVYVTYRWWPRVCSICVLPVCNI